MTPRSVLIVDDSAVSRIILRKHLLWIRPIWRYTEACSGEDALEIARHLRFDLAVLDIHMPGIDGLDTARALKVIQPNLTVSILTADSREIRRGHADVRKLHFFDKPIDREKAQAIAALSDRTTYGFSTFE